MHRMLKALVFAVVLAGVSYGQICVNCIKVRVGRPWLIRTPDPSNRIADNYFNEVALSGGGFRGFSANGVTMSMDGVHTWDMGGALTQVLSRGASGSFDECGRWLNDNYQSGATLFGFYHAEHTCPYPQTHKSMALATSTDQGHNWTIQGQILDRNDSGSGETGMGDCTAVNDTSFHYLYCLRGSDHQTIIARAPLGNPYPGNWVKYFNGLWNGSAFSTQDTGIGYIGSGISLWTSPGYQVLLQSEDTSFHGVKMSLASDWVNFTKINEPIVYQDAYIWGSSPNELLAYPSAIDSTDGNRRWSSGFQLWFTWVPPNGTLSSNRYLGARDVSVTLMGSPQSPQVGVEVSRWLNSSAGERWSTTGPVPGNFSSFAYQGGFGYLMTKQLDASWIKIVDCQSDTNWAGHPDHILTSGTCDTSYHLVRTAGWAYPNGTPPANTLALYRCYDTTLQSHFASNASNCEGLGTMESQIGYVLAN
jgi:hypothetical protein